MTSDTSATTALLRALGLRVGSVGDRVVRVRTWTRATLSKRHVDQRAVDRVPNKLWRKRRRAVLINGAGDAPDAERRDGGGPPRVRSGKKGPEGMPRALAAAAHRRGMRLA